MARPLTCILIFWGRLCYVGSNGGLSFRGQIDRWGEKQMAGSAGRIADRSAAQANHSRGAAIRLLGGYSLAVLTVVLAVTWILIYVANTHLVLPRFLALEKAEAEKNFERAANILRSEFESIKNSTRDYALWDDMYDYALSPSPAFEEMNLDWTSFHNNNHLDLALVYNRDDNLLWGNLNPIGSSLPAEAPVSPAATHVLAAVRAALRDRESIGGIFLLREGMILIGATHIARHTRPSAPVGLIIFGRLLDREALGKLQKQTALPLRLIPSAQEPDTIAVSQQGKIVSVDGPVPTELGKAPLRLVIATDRPIFNSGKRTAGFLGMAIGIFGVFLGLAGMVITGQVVSLKQSKDKLVKSEARQRGLVQAIPDLIFILRRDGTFIDCHAPDSDLLPARPDEFISKKIGDFFPASETKRFMASIAKALESGRLISFEYELTLKNGTHYFEARAMKTVVDEVFLICRDITQSKTMESIQRELEAKLQQAHRLETIGSLAGGVAHEFNNLLQIMSGRIELIKKNDPLADTYNVGIVEDAIARAEGLVNSLLTFASKIEIRPCQLDLNDALAESLAVAAAMIPSSIEIQTAFAPQRIPVWADRNQIGQILINLMTNARDAMPEDGRLSLSTGLLRFDAAFLEKHPAATAESYGYFQVGDTGTGIPAENLPRIYDPFFSTKEVNGGRGLGLSIVLGIVRNHQGFIECQSRKGEGTVFTVYFPSRDNGAGAPLKASGA